MTNNAAARMLGHTSDRFPEKTALVFRDRVTPYADLNRNARAFATLLQARGIKPSDRVALLLPDSPAFVTAFFGALLLGAVPVPIGMALRDEDKTFILNDSGAKLLVTDDATARTRDTDEIQCDLDISLDHALSEPSHTPYEPSPDDLACLLYTSGSTGRPKGVPHSHADLLVPAATLGPAVFGDVSSDILLSASKLSFSYGLMAQLCLGLAGGATIILHPEPPDAALLPQLILRRRPTVFFAVPAVYDMLLRTLDTHTDLSFMRICISSGEALPPPLHEAWAQRTGLAITELLGSTETLTSFMATQPGRDTPGTLGRPVEGFAIRTVDTAGNKTGDETGKGTHGALQVRGPGIARAYWNRPEQSTATMLADGWLETGDLCIRKNGELVLVGRTDDLFRSGGQWVAPLQVEECLMRHPAIQACAVAPCHVRGMAYPCAFVVLSGSQQPPSSGELIRFAKKRLPRHMCPVQIVFTNALPRTATGKIQRHKLKV
ncbi:MAG: AMP-binding protein [Pseudodesulfovibrio sp.]|uniref:AMP-dependent synthetase and ligase n=1 Tax=Pseudodesulfovibrio aespoeensis (strain ATCC 700646 / DSM 10631 / Aspo-2) TaxID=643562 RepID=E6VRU0_PSEA9|nr:MULTISPECIES: AMP-binding protein [Pseudodesulfovibrio]MBU4245396.1 AMP-binding protein [Pseudomonadota bacterium]ADU64227.1 AMP-dependent synthetase and ligase [Pseudodesulfovibrio aespoeensis Aspo-2]MBU4380276.1 AMP-binding protein [Pseudomonadota bacterium]MBU4474856.1 AMP-binding protein [Pseudomonadota bacterium]MBU4516404.1 AMP-binding protein [Pseudomonadota bacterium]